MKLSIKSVILVCLIALPVFAGAMSSSQLRTMLDDGRVVVIDIRSKADFRRGHIQGSLRIPAIGLQRRSVPPFGRVVVVWDGLDEESATRAQAILDGKPGINAELLVGGYPAWTKAGGYPAAANIDKAANGETKWKRTSTPAMTWQQLMVLVDDPELVVIDLRHAPRRKHTKPVTEQAELTDLAALLPNARIVAPVREQRRAMKREQQSARGLDRQGVRKRHVPDWLRGQNLNADGLYVLVDLGDGRLSERVARRMRARGLKRVYMLIGGERTLASGGESESMTLETKRPAGVIQ